MRKLPLPGIFLLALIPQLFVAQTLPSQNQEQEAAVTKKAARILMSFGRFALSQKVGPKAKAAFEEILREYDKDHAGARKALGFKKQDGAWRPPKKVAPKRNSRKKGKWEDDANDDKRFKVIEKWRDARLSLADLHKKHGLAIWESDQKTARRHLQRAVVYDPFDKEAHEKLGHVKAMGYYGTKEQIAFIQSMKKVESFALSLAKKNYKITPVLEIPPELGVLNLEVHGAKSKHFQVFTRGTQKNANDCVLWAERALDFIEFCLGPENAKKTKLRERFQPHGWLGFVWTPRERDKMIRENVKQNPNSAFTRMVQDARSRQQESAFANLGWGDKNGSYDVTVKLTPSQMHDRLIAYIWKRVTKFPFGPGKPANDPLSEGAMHASTWYMLSTAITKYGTLPKGTVGDRQLRLPKSVNWWMREMRDQATAREDMPINEVPRIDTSAFPANGRLKTWSFMTWLIARYPRKWFDFLLAVPGDKKPFPAEVDKVAQQVFERSLKDIEEEWRVWASGRGVTAAATGYGPPLLPAAPNAGQIAGLKRLNELRKKAGLPEV